jgi:spermidine synthase
MADTTGFGPRLLPFVVFTVGAASLGAEIAAARLLAPYFGASTIVWANTIGVVLVALSVGYWLGGRFADRHPHLKGLCALVLVSAGLLALVPFLSRPFLHFSVEAFEDLSAFTFLGSLFGVLTLVAVPVVLLGACAPYAVRLAVRDVRRSGEVAGRLYALSTAGSLLGTMSAALFLIPFAGTQRTFLVFAAALALVAAAGLCWRYAAAPLALVGATLLPVGTVKATGEGRVLFEGETEHQYVRVVEQPDGDRLLELNEGQAVHSMYRPGSYLTEDYWDGFLVLPLAALGRSPERVAMLGNAAGTVARAYGHYFPETAIDGVEIDGELTELGRRYFGLHNPHLRTFGEDARPFLHRSEGGYDAIFLDTYRQPYIPFYLATREFFQLVRERLAGGGVVVINVGHPKGSDELEKVVGRTLAEVFPVVLRDPIEPTNTLLLASEGSASAHRLEAAASRLPGDLARLARRRAGSMAPRLSGGEVYTDDRAPVEWLVDRTLLGYARDEGD